MRGISSGVRASGLKTLWRMNSWQSKLGESKQVEWNIARNRLGGTMQDFALKCSVLSDIVVKLFYLIQFNLKQH